MRILLTNDDGIHARGIHSLAQELSSLGELFVVAPDRERSGTGHSITVFDPIRVITTSMSEADAAWIVGGTPVDCVKLALNTLVKQDIDLVVSGINHGPNLGTDVLYSGTVSAAAEGVLLGIPSLAVSLNSYREDMDFDYAARFTRNVIRMVGERELGKKTLININIPPLREKEIKGVRITKLGIRNYDNLFEERRDPRGNTYYWLGGGVVRDEQEPESDVVAVQDGYISMTPIHLDLTDYRLIDEYRQFLAVCLKLPEDMP